MDPSLYPFMFAKDPRVDENGQPTAPSFWFAAPPAAGGGGFDHGNRFGRKTHQDQHSKDALLTATAASTIDIMHIQEQLNLQQAARNKAVATTLKRQKILFKNLLQMTDALVDRVMHVEGDVRHWKSEVKICRAENKALTETVRKLERRVGLLELQLPCRLEKEFEAEIANLDVPLTKTNKPCENCAPRLANGLGYCWLHDEEMKEQKGQKK